MQRKQQPQAKDSEAVEVELTPAFTNWMNPEVSLYSSDDEGELAAKLPWKESMRNTATGRK